MDWNWFHSAVAQSSAAIVGIFGAFVFTKIINNQAQFNQRCAKLTNLMQDARRLKDEAGNRYFAWYNRLTNEDELKDLRKDLQKEEKLHTPEYYFFVSGFSLYQPVDAIFYKVQELVEAEKKKRERPLRTSFSNRIDPCRGLHIEGFPTIDHSILTRRTDKLETEKDNIDKITVAVRAHASKIMDFIAESQKHPESSSLITISIIFSLALFYVGVLYPLIHLPALINIGSNAQTHADMTIKLFILISIAVLFTGIMALFLVLNFTMKMKDCDMIELTLFSNESEYSEFLGYAAENLLRSKGIV